MKRCNLYRSKSGKRARTGGSDRCRWCDADVLAVTKGSIEGRKGLNQALTAFRPDAAVYDAALAKLGQDFVRASNFCCDAGCVFSCKNPGERSVTYRPGRVRSWQSDLCFWCDRDVVSAAETTPNGIRRIAKDLRKFSTSRSDAFRAAASRLSAEFLQDLRVCSWEAEQKAMLKEDLVEQHNTGRCYYVDPDPKPAEDRRYLRIVPGTNATRRSVNYRPVCWWTSWHDFSERVCDDYAEGGYVQESLADKYQEKLEELQRFSTYR